MPGILLACSRPQDAQAGVPRHRMGSSCCIKPGLCCGAGAGAVLDALLACGSLQELVLSNNMEARRAPWQWHYRLSNRSMKFSTNAEEVEAT